MTGESAETLTKSRHFVLRLFLLTANFQPNSVTGADNKRSPLSRLLTAGSASTLNGGGEEENLSAYFEPFGSALVPCALSKVEGLFPLGPSLGGSGLACCILLCV